MKTIIYIIVILFSFVQIRAQEATLTTSEKATLEKTKKNTKIDFYETLIAINNFDIKIKKNDVVATKSKNEFYKNLIIKNGFNIDFEKKTRLTNRYKKDTDFIIKNSIQVSGL